MSRPILILHIALALPTWCPFATQVALSAQTRTTLRTTPMLPKPVSVLAEVDMTHPLCDQPVDLNVGRDYFTQVLNDLPGRTEYNRLVTHYQRAEWDEFDKLFESIKKIFETSPLLEAVTFLGIQSELERVKSQADLTQAEKHFREVLLLYPKSDLVPVVTAAMAYYWIHIENYERSLSIYENARVQFEQTPHACVFHLGVAESLYQMSEFDASKSALTKIVEKCVNRRVRTAARLRQFDIDLKESKKVETSRFEEILATAPIVIEHHYPWVLHNIGEHYYQSQQFEKAKFYFDNYLKQSGASPQCSASAQKRLGDISLRQGGSLAQITENYYKATDRDKSGKYAVFCYLHGLLVGYKMATSEEKALRLSIFDKEVESIKDPILRSLAYLEKGLAVLESLEPSAVGYLVRLHHREKLSRSVSLNEGPVGKTIGRLFGILVKKAGQTGGELALELEGDIQNAHLLWNANSNLKVTDYSEVYMQAFEHLLKSIKLKEAIALSKRWKECPFWPKNISDQMKDRVANVLWSKVQGDESQVITNLIWANRQVLGEMTGGKHQLIWYSLALRQSDEKELAQLEREFTTHPTWMLADSPGLGKPNGKKSSIDSDWEMARGTLYERLGKWSQARQVYHSFKDPKLNREIILRLFAIAKALKDKAALMALGPEIIQSVPESEKRTYLNVLTEAILSGKHWKDGLALDGRRVAMKLSDRDEGHFDFVVARSAFETGNLTLAAERYQTAIQRDPLHPDASEGFFKLGKCFLKLGNSERAREVFGGLVKRNDGFWSPLAANELSWLDRTPASQK